MRITWRGHSCFELATAGGARLLVDPYLENGFTRTRPEDFRDVDAVLVTHAHEDHVGSTVEIGRPVVANWEIGHRLERLGARDVTTMNTGGFHRVGDARVWMAPAVHSSGFDDDADAPYKHYGGHPCGFVVDDGETRFYHLGDTGLFGDLKHVVRDVLKPHVAAVPIGDLYTMGPEHAAIAVEWLGVSVALPMHYDTFEGIRQDPHAWARLVKPPARAVVPGPDESVEVEGGRLVAGPEPAAAR